MLNPSFARGWATSGPLRIWAGQHDLAIEHTERSSRLNPRAHIGPQFWVLGIAHFFLRRFDEAAGLMPSKDQHGPGPIADWLPVMPIWVGWPRRAR